MKPRLNPFKGPFRGRLVAVLFLSALLSQLPEISVREVPIGIQGSETKRSAILETTFCFRETAVNYPPTEWFITLLIRQLHILFVDGIYAFCLLYDKIRKFLLRIHTV